MFGSSSSLSPREIDQPKKFAFRDPTLFIYTYLPTYPPEETTVCSTSSEKVTSWHGLGHKNSQRLSANPFPTEVEWSLSTHRTKPKICKGMANLNRGTSDPLGNASYPVLVSCRVAAFPIATVSRCILLTRGFREDDGQ